MYHVGMYHARRGRNKKLSFTKIIVLSYVTPEPEYVGVWLTVIVLSSWKDRFLFLPFFHVHLYIINYVRRDEAHPCLYETEKSIFNATKVTKT